MVSKKRKTADGQRECDPADGEHTPPTRALQPVPVDALLREHEHCLAAACELLEDPDAERNGAVPAGLKRAAAGGHTWLSRISFRPHADKLVQPALLGSVRPPAM
eukprot:6296315-Prymnesium_polylepis.1